MIPRALLVLISTAATLAALPLGGALAQTPDPEGPVLVYQNIEDGAVLNELPLSIQMCFKDPINNKDLDKGGEFSFSVIQPDGIALGHRDIFQVDGYGVAVQPGNPVDENVNGEWTFRYRVTTPDALHATEGTIRYTIDPNGDPAPRVSPPACVPSGGTATASPDASTPTPLIVSPTASATDPPDSATSNASPSPVVTREPGEDDGDDEGLDFVEIALITLGVTGGLAALALVGYFVRRAVSSH